MVGRHLFGPFPVSSFAPIRTWLGSPRPASPHSSATAPHDGDCWQQRSGSRSSGRIPCDPQAAILQVERVHLVHTFEASLGVRRKSCTTVVITAEASECTPAWVGLALVSAPRVELPSPVGLAERRVWVATKGMLMVAAVVEGITAVAAAGITADTTEWVRDGASARARSAPPS